jgi:hypothetical protein
VAENAGDGDKKRKYNILDEIYLPRGRPATTPTAGANGDATDRGRNSKAHNDERPSKKPRMEPDLFGNREKREKLMANTKTQRQSKRKAVDVDENDVRLTNETEADGNESSDDEIGIPNPVAPKAVSTFALRHLKVSAIRCSISMRCASCLSIDSSH